MIIVQDEENIIFTFTDVASTKKMIQNMTVQVIFSGTMVRSGTLILRLGNTWIRMTTLIWMLIDGSQDLRSTSKIFTMADADASGHLNIPIYAWDECGNRDFCLVNMRLDR